MTFLGFTHKFSSKERERESAAGDDDFSYQVLKLFYN